MSRIATTSRTACSSRCGPSGFEPATHGLKELSTTESFHRVKYERDRVVTFADHLLQLGAEGGVIAREDAETLAREWLSLTGADLAMRVLMGGANEAARLVELCACVLQTLGAASGSMSAADDNTNGGRP